MFASPFGVGEEQNMFASNVPQSSSSGHGKITIDGIIDALISARDKGRKAENELRNAQQKRSQAANALVDLGNNNTTYIVGEKVFASTEVYRPVSSFITDIKEAKRELKRITVEARSSSQILDPDTVKFKLLRTRVSLLDDKREEPIGHSYGERSPGETTLTVGTMPIGADLIDLPGYEEEDKNFKESFNHFDDDVVLPEAEVAGAAPKSSMDFDIDRWFAAPTRATGTANLVPFPAQEDDIDNYEDDRDDRDDVDSGKDVTST